MFEIEKILDTRKLQDYFSVEADILDLLAATSRLSKVASLTGEKLLKSSNATDVTIVASNDNHSKDMSKRVTVAASRNNLTSIAGVNVAFRTSPEASKNTSMVSVYYPEDVVSKWCTGMIANETDCKNGEGLITTLAYWFSSSQEFAAVTDWTSGLDSLREQLGSGNLPTRKLASHSGGAQEGERPGLDVPEVLPVSGVLDVKATYQDYIPAELEAWLGIPVQADAFEAERLTSCVRLEQATTGLGFVATYLPSSTAPGISGPWGCRVQFPGRYLVVQLKEDGQGGQPPGGGQPGGGQGPIALPPAQRIEQLLSQALELGKDIVPPEFTEVFSFIAMVDGRLLDGQVFRTLTDLANDIQRSLAKFLSQNIPLGDVFRDIGPCPACIEAVDIVSQGSLPDWDLIGALVPSATSIRYRVHLPVEVPGLDVQNIAWTVILRSPLESILGSSPAQQMVMFFQEAYDAAENLVEDLADYSGRRYTQVQNELRSAYQIGKSLVEMADSTDIGTTLQTNFGSINAAFSRIAAEVAVSSPDIQFRVIPTNNSAEIIMGSVQTNTPDRTEWCSRVDCNGVSFPC
ncbi:hypothetical protein DUNSADRAFT_9311 [Dunaliella salina]|uniref:Uncharacterized protein n=1 Tax=Dunaliella salina TaxID=3046 RepID=A0ABQ7GHM6_DUNSA|nr:hypothetical protein DUNSADRAFT_9311 [Dunaliella salina]|eukprot:KAF5834115.1 hypothetical protein DUNSADRAFT_9311 [Dunaliella salina]